MTTQPDLPLAIPAVNGHGDHRHTPVVNTPALPAAVAAQAKAALEAAPVPIPVYSILPPEPDARDRDSEEYRRHEQRLTADIAARGVRQPIYVLRLGDHQFRALTGWTRTLASRRAGQQSIPAYVLDRPMSEAEQEMEKLLENEIRHGFTPLERARAYQRLLTLNGWSQARLAREVHESPAEVSKVLAISKRLPEDVQALVASGTLPARAAYALTRLDDPIVLRELADRCGQGLLKVEALEEEVGRLARKGQKAPAAKPVKARTARGLCAVLPALDYEAVLGELNALTEAVRKAQKHALPLSALPALLKGAPGA